MRVLITGMTAQQCNPVNHLRSPNFPGLLCEAFTNGSNVVTWTDPSVKWTRQTLSEFELIVCGVAPLTALGANRAYGALSLIEILWKDPRLVLLVDAPDPLKMASANQALVYHPENLVKDFYTNRKEYNVVREDSSTQERLLRGVHNLNNHDWPKTIVPQLPWQSTNHLEGQLPNARGKVVPMNLDRLLFKRFSDASGENRSVWAYEAGSHPTWGRRNGVITFPVITLPKTHRKDTTGDTIRLLSRSIGCIICPSKSGTWWSPRFAMSLSQMTPVFTDWHETQFLSESWTHLPGSFELMDHDERGQIALAQHDSYVASIPQYLPEI